jgi:hypothetical protein
MVAGNFVDDYNAKMCAIRSSVRTYSRLKLTSVGNISPSRYRGIFTPVFQLTVNMTLDVLQDLTAIGITKPSVRKKLKSEIGRLTIHDGIPDHKPVSVRGKIRSASLKKLAAFGEKTFLARHSSTFGETPL